MLQGSIVHHHFLNLLALDLHRLEIELKKRWAYPYYWGKSQDDSADQQTHFIYKTYHFERLLDKLSTLDKDLINYGLNRWYNFWSAMAVEQLFAEHPEVCPQHNKYDKLIDFSLCGITFDHKTSIFPRAFKRDFAYAKHHPEELISWLYANQSQEGRKHEANRLFVVLYDSQEQEHWQLKAEITLLKKAIDAYINSFSPKKLYRINSSLSDIIWLTR